MSHSKELILEYEDNVLSSEIIFDANEEDNPSTGEIEMLEVWQFTYQSSLIALSDYLDDEIPTLKNYKQIV